MTSQTFLVNLQDSPDIGDQGRGVVLRHRIELLASSFSKPHHCPLHGCRQLQEGGTKLCHHSRIGPHLANGLGEFSSQGSYCTPAPASVVSSHEPAASRSWSRTRFEAEEDSMLIWGKQQRSEVDTIRTWTRMSSWAWVSFTIPRSPDRVSARYWVTCNQSILLLCPGELWKPMRAEQIWMKFRWHVEQIYNCLCCVVAQIISQALVTFKLLRVR